MHPLAAGASGGVIATIPMTALMSTWLRLLPRGQQQPLPPRKIAMRVARRVGVADRLDPADRHALTAAGHLGYGAATGAAYAALVAGGMRAGAASGVAFGLAVWTVSYLGWLPATHLHRSATREPAARNAMMIVAHVVWGAALGAFVGRAAGARRVASRTE
ncbi:MAG TPA: DUF1440 domain-containing protein [Planctomycetota bacterium]|nr:DUF1440 domain-containing protein [Planctomycetota bacterium]